MGSQFQTGECTQVSKDEVLTHEEVTVPEIEDKGHEEEDLDEAHEHEETHEYTELFHCRDLGE